MINKLLSFVGLMKIKRAETLTLRMHLYYIEIVNEWVKKDFKIKSNTNCYDHAEKWWADIFKKVLKPNSNDVTLVNDKTK